MKQKKKILNPYKRKLVLGEDTWTYRITRSTLEICNPEQTKKFKFIVDTAIDNSCDCDSGDECYICSGYSDINFRKREAITPSKVKGYVEAIIRGDKIVLRSCI